MGHTQRKAAQLVAAGDAAVLVRLGSRPGPTATRRVLALVAALDAAPPPGLLDVIPAYASVLVRFDPLVIAPMEIVAYLRVALSQASEGQLPAGRIVKIPVRYGGKDGPDLDEVASLLGLTAQELIQRHASATYRVAFLGFLAGYPYLSGLPRSLAVPRLNTPRTGVPAGSVAIAERQAGIYPVDSPGGWRILGRTSTPIFDPARNPPSLLRPGDRLRFYPVSASEEAAPPANKQADSNETCALWLRVIQPGIQTTVQDPGRIGYSRYGVSTSGAADLDALALGNALLANSPDAAALEITGGNASFEALAPCVVAITGAPCVVRVNGGRVYDGVSFALAVGDILELGATSAGMRVYLCVDEGVAVPRVMGSRATDLRARLGGLEGRPLRVGDLLARGRASVSVAGRVSPSNLASRRLPGNGEWRLRVLPGPHFDQAPRTSKTLLTAAFTVDARADRVGVRLRSQEGSCLEGGQMLTEGLPRGAVQLPPDGDPVLLLADAQTTGGYRVPLVVISADRWQIGQLRPGDIVRFCSVSPEEALAALRRRADDITRIARQPSPARLLSGFTEWDDDTDPAMS